MRRMVRNLVTGSIVGAVAGLVMLAARRQRNNMMQSNYFQNQARGRNQNTMNTMREKAIDLTTAAKDKTAAFSRRLARRMT